MKRIVIIGGGISGLTLLHYLKQRFADTVDITLLEREATVGGTIHTITTNNCLFETGPNGFLNNQPSTIQLIEELDLSDQLIKADSKAKRRYIQLKGQLHPLPVKPIRFIRSSLLSYQDKWSLIKGIFKRNVSTNQTIYDYVAQRFNSNIAEYLADPFITGIYAGNIKRLHMASVFPTLGSKAKKPKRIKKCMFSFQKGMGQLIESLSTRYQVHIQTKTEIVSLDNIKADAIIVCTPAHVTSRIIQGVNPSLAVLLEQIPYAPVAVTGLLFNRNSFKQQPDGFGYLIPSKENKDVLGVLLESNVYTKRGGEDQTMIRVMLGGMHHPSVAHESQEEIIAKAIKEINTTYGLNANPLETFVKIWPKGIPQYELNYPSLRQNISEELKKTPHIHLCANYLEGISFNDCINQAKSIASTIRI